MKAMNEKETVLRIDLLNKRFKTVQALRDLSFSVDRGDIFAFLGPNGAGKTTTLRILLDMIRADSGSIAWYFNGQQVSLPDPPLIGYLPEERGLYTDLPVIRSLVYLASIRGMQKNEARTAAVEWLERLDLADRANEKLMALSKGNQQKIQFISSILHKPAFAILDEPFSGLDPVNQEKFINYIRELNKQGMTILLSSHQMTLVEKLANKVCLINRGESLFNGSMSEIYKAYGNKHMVDVTFENAVPVAEIQSFDGVESAVGTDPGTARIVLQSGTRLAPFFSQLAGADGVTHIRSHSRNLHDIFITLVNNHQL